MDGLLGVGLSFSNNYEMNPVHSLRPKHQQVFLDNGNDTLYYNMMHILLLPTIRNMYHHNIILLLLLYYVSYIYIYISYITIYTLCCFPMVFPMGNSLVRAPLHRREALRGRSKAAVRPAVVLPWCHGCHGW